MRFWERNVPAASPAVITIYKGEKPVVVMEVSSNRGKARVRMSVPEVHLALESGTTVADAVAQSPVRIAVEKQPFADVCTAVAVESAEV